MPEKIDTEKLLHSVARSDEYTQYRQRAEVLSKSQSNAEKLTAKNKAIRMGAFAMAHANTSESGYRSPEGTLFELMGHLDTFSRAQSMLDTRNDLPRDRRREYKKDVIGFNHALKDAIDKNASVGFNGMLRHMTEAYASLHGNENARVFMGQARTALVGMQHERAAEQIIDATGTFMVDYDREVGVEDELSGVDLYVIDTRTDASFGIDLKASESTVEKSRLKSHNPDKIVWSQCRNEDFGDSFTLNPDVAKRKAAGMSAYLNAASGAATRSYAS